jgi:predicted permease
MFTAVNAVLLRELPVAEQDRIVVSWGLNRERSFSHLPFHIRAAREFAERSRTMQQVALVDYNGSWPLFFREGDRAYPARRGLVSGNFFQTLGAAPFLGRLFDPADDRVGADPVAVISFAFWQRQFGASRDVIGRRVTLHASGVTFTIIGVAPEGLDYPGRTEIWLPILPLTTFAPADTSVALVDFVGRLAPDASLEVARAEVTSLLKASPHEIERQSVGVSSTLPDILLGDVRGAFAVLASAVVVLLLVSCVNVAGLLLMRGVQLEREIAVRMAIGASARRILRRQMAEGLLLAAAGGAIGIAVAYLALGLLLATAPAQLPRLEEIRLDGVALIAGVAVALATALLFGIGPALVAARTDAAHLLRAGTQSLSGGRRNRRARELLVVAQVTAAVVVLAAAGLVSRSVVELQRAELGFEKDRVMIVELAWDFTRVGTAERSLALYDAMLPRVGAIPGVAAATALLLTPFPGTGGWDALFVAADRSAADQKSSPWLNMEVVSPSYFDVFRIPLRRGRLLSSADRTGAPRAVVLSEGAARALWPEGEALGRQVQLASTDSSRWTVVGIVADTRYRDYRRPRETVYFAHHQPPFPLAATMLAVRSEAGDPLTLLPQIRSAVSATDASVLVASAASMESHLDAPLAQPRFNALLLSAFALSAMLIVSVGLYAVLAFAVRMRARELAIRSAVGAGPAALRWLILRSAGALVAGGIVVGLVLALPAARLLGTMLYNVSPTDPASIAAGVGLLLLVALMASIVPAQLAARASAAKLLRDT